MSEENIEDLIDDDILDLLAEDPEPTQAYPLQEEYDGIGLRCFGARPMENEVERYRDAVLSGVRAVLNDPASLFVGVEDKNTLPSDDVDIAEKAKAEARLFFRKFMSDEFISKVVFVVRDCALTFNESDDSWMEFSRYMNSDEEVCRCSSVVLVEQDRSTGVSWMLTERFAGLAMRELVTFGRSHVVILPTGGAHAARRLQQPRRPSQPTAEAARARRRQPSVALSHQYRRSSNLPFLAVVAPFSLPEIAALGLLSPRKPKAVKLEAPADIKAYDMAHLPATAQERVDEMTLWLFEKLLTMDRGAKVMTQEAQEAAREFFASKGISVGNG